MFDRIASRGRVHDVRNVDDEFRHDAELGRQSSEKYEGRFYREIIIQRRYFELEHIPSDYYARFV